MNQRIRQLTKQAGFVGYGEDSGAYNIPASAFESRMEKFAELIVEECCSKLKEMGESWHEFANNPPQGQAHNASGALFAAYRLKEDAVDEIKKHFGVER